MPNAKKCYNGFYFFMVEVRKREEANGVYFSSMDEVHPLATIEWGKMSEDEKDIYKENARAQKLSAMCRLNSRLKKRQLGINAGPKPAYKQKQILTPDLDSLADNELVHFYEAEDDAFCRRREKDRHELQLALIWNLGATGLEKSVTETYFKAIMSERFYVVAVQSYYHTSDHKCAPAEFAIVEFTLNDGITNEYNVILKPTEDISDSKGAVLKEIMATHKIAPDNVPAEGRDDYDAIVDEIKKFYGYKEFRKQFRAFTLSSQFNFVQGAIREIRQKAMVKNFISYEKISCIEDLYMLLCLIKEKRADVTEFRDVLTETNWQFEPSIVCRFHGKVQSKYCALGVAKKTCHYLLQSLKSLYDLTSTCTQGSFVSVQSNCQINKKFEEEEQEKFCTPSCTFLKDSRAPIFPANLNDSSDYFKMHSIRPPPFALKRPQSCDERYSAKVSDDNLPSETLLRSENLLTSTFNQMSIINQRLKQVETDIRPPITKSVCSELFHQARRRKSRDQE